jgi:tetratricopeptide (TPR) repeat protein
LVGRDREVSALRELLVRATGGEGFAAVVRAEPGGGKTRLALEARAAAEEMGMAVLWGAASEATSEVPLLPLAEALNNALTAEAIERLQLRMRPAHRLAAMVVPSLFPDQEPPEHLDDAAKPALFEALLAVLSLLGDGRGSLLVLDDAHWADSATRQLLGHWAARAPHAPLALVITWRDGAAGESLAALLRTPATVELALAPLRRADVARLGAEIMGAPARADLVAEVVERSAGNPFAVAELFAAALRSDLDDELPRSVRDAVLGRARGLLPDDLRVLEAGAVLSGEFEAAIVAVVAGVAPGDAVAALGRLSGRGLLEAAARSRFSFRHALVAAAVRSEMGEADTRAVHGRAAAILTEKGAPPAELAYHLFAAGAAEKAVPFAIAAAQEAERQGANAEASRLYERAADNLDAGGERGELLERAAWNALVAFEILRARELAERSIPWLTETGRATGRARATLSQTLQRLGDVEGAREERRKALAELAGAPPSPDLAHVLMMVAAELMALWEVEEAMALAERSVAVAEAVGDERSLMMARGVIGTCLAQLGRFDEAISILDETTEWALGHRLYMPSLAGVANSCTARTMSLRGRDALDLLQGLDEDRRALLSPELHRVEAQVLAYVAGPREVLAAVAACAVTAMPLDTSRMALFRALALLELDRAADAIELLDRTQTDPGVRHTRLRVALQARVAEGLGSQAVEEAREALDAPLVFPIWTVGAEAAVEALLATGEERNAIAALRARRGEADEGDPWWRLAWARVHLAEDPNAAAGDAAAAAERFHEAGYPWDEGRAGLVLASALRSASDDEGARTALRSVLGTAKEHGIEHHARLAREGLAALGDAGDTITRDRIRGILESLDDTTRVPAGLRAQLTRGIEELVAAGGREGEAGTILRDYYVKKVGSQEVVAERHYLTRPTFYRRLHLGWELLASRLGPLDEAPTGSARER